MNNFQKKIFLSLLYYIPWVNIINYRISSLIAFGIILVFIVLLIFNGLLYRSPKDSLYLNIIKENIFLFITPLLLCIYYIIIATMDNQFMFFHLYIFLLFIIPPFINLREFVDRCFERYIVYLIIVISLSIIIDFGLLFIGRPSLQLMYNPDNYTYIDRPSGIFGQPSVNASIICSLFLLFCYVKRNVKIINYNKKLFLLVVFAAILQGSGSGYISLSLMIIALYNKKLRSKQYLLYILFITFIVGSFYVIKNNIINKISFEYMSFLYEYCMEIFDDFNHNIGGFGSKLLFGNPYDNEFPIDFGPLFYISHVGLFSYLSFLLSLIILFHKEQNIFFRYNIIILFIGGLHYPVMHYVVMHFMWLLIFWYVYSSNKKNRLKSFHITTS